MSKIKTQRETLVRNVRKFWDSLETHLPYVIQRNPPGSDPRLFHVETCIEYCEDMLASLKALR